MTPCRRATSRWSTTTTGSSRKTYVKDSRNDDGMVSRLSPGCLCRGRRRARGSLAHGERARRVGRRAGLLAPRVAGGRARGPAGDPARAGACNPHDAPGTTAVGGVSRRRLAEHGPGSPDHPAQCGPEPHGRCGRSSPRGRGSGSNCSASAGTSRRSAGPRNSRPPPTNPASATPSSGSPPDWPTTCPAPSSFSPTDGAPNPPLSSRWPKHIDVSACPSTSCPLGEPETIGDVAIQDVVAPREARPGEKTPVARRRAEHRIRGQTGRGPCRFRLRSQESSAGEPADHPQGRRGRRASS